MYRASVPLGYSLLGGALGLPRTSTWHYQRPWSGAWRMGRRAALSGTALGATLGSAVPGWHGHRRAAPRAGGIVFVPRWENTSFRLHQCCRRQSIWPGLEALMTQGHGLTGRRGQRLLLAGILRRRWPTPRPAQSWGSRKRAEEYQAQVLARLNAETVSFGRGSTAGRKGVTDTGRARFPVP